MKENRSRCYNISHTGYKLSVFTSAKGSAFYIVKYFSPGKLPVLTLRQYVTISVSQKYCFHLHSCTYKELKCLFHHTNLLARVLPFFSLANNQHGIPLSHGMKWITHIHQVWSTCPLAASYFRKLLSTLMPEYSHSRWGVYNTPHVCISLT